MTRASIRAVSCGLLGLSLGLAGAATGAADDAPAAPVAATAAFEALKGLNGTWTIGEAPADAEAATIVYKLTGGGSALVENMFPGSAHEMVTVYHLNGDDLVLTHYCAVGNQPHMKLDRKASTPTSLVFAFDGGTNFDPSKDMHMHEGRFELLADGRVKATWTAFKDGKPAGSHEFTMSRSK